MRRPTPGTHSYEVGSTILPTQRLYEATLVRIVVAFASARHAQDAVGFLARTALVAGAMDVSGGDGPSFATVSLELEARNRDRLLTLVSGLHGIVMQERDPALVA